MNRQTSNILIKIQKWQTLMNVRSVQDSINDGTAFLDLSLLDKAARYMFLGVCHLPLKTYIDLYGNVVPSIHDSELRSIGSVENCALFYGILELRLN